MVGRSRYAFVSSGDVGVVLDTIILGGGSAHIELPRRCEGLQSDGRLPGRRVILGTVVTAILEVSGGPARLRRGKPLLVTQIR